MLHSNDNIIKHRAGLLNLVEEGRMNNLVTDHT